MKIVIVGPAFPYKGGGSHHTTELAHRLAGAGHEVVLESWKAQYPSFLYPGQQTISAPEGAPFSGTRRELAWYRPDGWVRAGRRFRSADLVVFVVLSTVQAPAYLGMLLGLGHGRSASDRSASGPGACGRARTVALCHNVLPHERKPYDEPLMRALLRRVDSVLVHSEAQASAAKSLTSTPVTTAEMAPHFPAPAPGSSPAAGVRRRLLFFGMVRPYKGLDVLLRALAAGPPDVTLTVAGEFWSDVSETRSLISSLGLADRVELLPGYQPAADVPGLFASADALVLPYRAATASQNVDLAFAHGLPAIVTRTGTLPDQIRDGIDGLVCEPGDEGSLTDAIKRFYDDDPARYRGAVRPVDSKPRWDAYITALVGRPIAKSATLSDARSSGVRSQRTRSYRTPSSPCLPGGRPPDPRCPAGVRLREACPFRAASSWCLSGAAPGPPVPCGRPFAGGVLFSGGVLVMLARGRPRTPVPCGRLVAGGAVLWGGLGAVILLNNFPSPVPPLCCGP